MVIYAQSSGKPLNTNNLHKRRQNMSIASEITVGTVAIVKIGRNEVEVVVTEITANGWKVKSQTTGREFEVKRIERIVTEPVADAATEAPSVKTEAAAAETDAEDDTPNPAPESCNDQRPEKKLSLLNAAAQVLAASRVPMNCKEVVAKAVEMGLWTPTGAKTPEQTLYSGIFREMKSGAESRFKKSETRKGSFEYAK